MSAKNSGKAPVGSRDLLRGRFAGGLADIMEQINASIDVDARLYAVDIEGSKAHVRMLVAQGIVASQDGETILDGLDAVRAEIEGGVFEFSTALEDIHMNIEARLAELIGTPAGRLHTARSRNDQVATDFRLWVRDALDSLDGDLAALQGTLIETAETHVETVMPGFTHLQSAQPVTLGHHLLAYVEMLGRDRGRFADARIRLNECPLGAGALAGTSFPIDRTATAAALGFDRPTANSLDSVSDRDFALEAMAGAAICAVHLSRFAEELVVWSSAEFAYIRLSDGFTTSSSIMPQKRNPDAAELVRGKTGRIVGDLAALLITLKGLALSYAKDMQEDKEPAFDALDQLSVCLKACAGMVAAMTVDDTRMSERAGDGFSTATDLADWLVQALDMPFREAHGVVGRIVRLAEDAGVGLEAMELATMQSVEPGITAAVFDVLTPPRSVASRTSQGGTAPARVREALAAARARYL